MLFNRRAVLVGSAASILSAYSGSAAAADDPIVLDWSDLVPGEGGVDMDRLRNLGVVQHGQLNSPFNQELAAQVTDEFDGKLVRIPGYLVPLEYDGLGISAGLLVPYIGACIHVPPPPPNQLIFITTDKPYEAQGIFEPVWVTGMFGAAATATQLAEVGYTLSANVIEPYT